MKETIFTIPLNEAFDSEQACSFCVIEKKLEDEYTDYYLGAALMEPDHRIETNKNGFCKKHFEMLYNRQENRLGLGLVINTHLTEKLQLIKDTFEISKAGIIKAKGKKNSVDSYIDNALEFFKSYSNSCTVCTKETKTMDRYLEIAMYLYSSEPDFKKKFENRHGFCLKHTEFLLEGTKKYLKPNKRFEFVDMLMSKEIDSLEELNNDIAWFTKKFDYRYQDEPWKNSQDAIPRAIEKLKGFCRFK